MLAVVHDVPIPPVHSKFGPADKVADQGAGPLLIGVEIEQAVGQSGGSPRRARDEEAVDVGRAHLVGLDGDDHLGVSGRHAEPHQPPDGDEGEPSRDHDPVPKALDPRGSHGPTFSSPKQWNLGLKVPRPDSDPLRALAQNAKNPRPWSRGFFVELRGIEPLTSSMPWKRSTN